MPTTKKIMLVEVEFRERPRAGIAAGIDLYWDGSGWFHVYRNGNKVGVTFIGHFFTHPGGRLQVFREEGQD